MTERTLLIPCAGRSTRFPDMRPKWLLTHPDGRLMAEKALEGCDLGAYTKIVFVILKAHDNEFNAQFILRQAFARLGNKLYIVVLPDFTSGQADTVYQAIRAAKLTGAVLIKDSDNYLMWEDKGDTSNFVVSGNLYRLREVSNVAAKSYVLLDKNNIVLDIVEKKIISETFCAGAYQFASAKEFCSAFNDMRENAGVGTTENYVSHVIAWMIARHSAVFRGYEATGYEDWGTLQEWRNGQRRFSTFVCDLDGVLVKNIGKYGSKNWSNSLEPIDANLQTLKELQTRGAQIIVMTARTEDSRADLEALLTKYGIKAHAIVMGCYHSHRIIINDFAATNHFPSCSAVSIPRDSALAPYLQSYLTSEDKGQQTVTPVPETIMDQD